MWTNRNCPRNWYNWLWSITRKWNFWAFKKSSCCKGRKYEPRGKLINKLNKTLAGKTGTTNSNQDAWFVGFSSDLVVGVFVGFDNPATLGKRETGSSVAAPIFRDFMRQALYKKPDVPFRRPAGIKLIKVNPKTGLLSNSNSRDYIIEAFKPGQLPNKTSEFDIIDTPKEKDIVNSLSPLY